jgi:hypothetical protein
MIQPGRRHEPSGVVGRFLRCGVVRSDWAAWDADPYVVYCMNAKENVMNDDKYDEPVAGG